MKHLKNTQKKRSRVSRTAAWALCLLMLMGRFPARADAPEEAIAAPLPSASSQSADAAEGGTDTDALRDDVTEADPEPDADGDDETGDPNADDPGGDPDDDPAGDPGPTPGPDSDAVDDAEPTEPSDDDAAREKAEAALQRGDDVRYGALSALLESYESGDRVYIRAKTPVSTGEIPARLLLSAGIQPDPDVFSGNSWQVFYYPEDPFLNEEARPLTDEELKRLVDGEATAFYALVEKEQTPDPTPEAEIALTVEPHFYEGSDVWHVEYPEFWIYGLPEDDAWTIEAIVDGGATPSTVEIGYGYPEDGAYVYCTNFEGEHTLTFTATDGDRTAGSTSEYAVKIDMTPPEVAVSAEGLVLTLTAGDAHSGPAWVSLDGGLTGKGVNTFDGDVFTWEADESTTFEAGMIRVYDLAGNFWTNEEALSLTGDSGGGGGSGGSGGGAGDGKKPVSHGRADGTDDGPFDALTLELPEGPMKALEVGDTALPVTLTLAGSGEARFEAALAVWGGSAQPDAAADTLILSAVCEPDAGDRFEYRWTLGGEALRLLSNSGVNYLALSAHGEVVGLPTSGFVGGTAYAALRQGGVANSQFTYTLSMNFNLDPEHIPALSDCDFSRDCDLTIGAKVLDENYVLSDRHRGEMYHINVCLGPEALLDAPFGAYRPEEDKP